MSRREGTSLISLAILIFAEGQFGSKQRRMRLALTSVGRENAEEIEPDFLMGAIESVGAREICRRSNILLSKTWESHSEQKSGASECRHICRREEPQVSRAEDSARLRLTAQRSESPRTRPL